jgi:hypothetical protein
MQNKKKLCNGPCNSLQYIWKNEGGKRYCRRCWSAQSKPNTKPTVRQKRIRPRSSKKIKLDAEYSILRKDFLEKNPLCQARIPGKCSRVSTQVHHKAGRIGSLYLDVSKWLAICHECHTWATEFSKEAIEMGISEKRNT